MIFPILIIVIPSISLYYCIKLRKLDKERSELIGSIFLFSTVLKILPIHYKTGGYIFVFACGIVILLCKINIKKIEGKNKENCIKIEESTLEQ